MNKSRKDTYIINILVESIGLPDPVQVTARHGSWPLFVVKDHVTHDGRRAISYRKKQYVASQNITGAEMRNQRVIQVRVLTAMIFVFSNVFGVCVWVVYEARDKATVYIS
jgi:hypothetical protein